MGEYFTSFIFFSLPGRVQKSERTELNGHNHLTVSENYKLSQTFFVCV